MNDAPPIPRLRDASTDRLLTGHLWLQEWVDGRPCRFSLRDSGVLEVGDGDRLFDPADVPPPYRATVRHLRERLDRGALRDAVEDVEAVAFLGVATVRERVDYDWERVPPFLGYDVWLADEARFLPPDRAEAIYRGLGLAPVNAVRKEVRAVDFDPDDYGFPASNWYDGPAAGVVVRNKTGDRAILTNPAVAGGEEEDSDVAGGDATDADGPLPAEELAREVTTDRRIDRAREQVRSGGPEAVVERLLEAVFREECHRVDRLGGDDLRAFRSVVAAEVRRSLRDAG